ncbi:MAG TPA: hypothetical protein VNQ32_12985 [Steroidobacteraceae bacterium]|nr:hypothetical protein [Steroidobacteraceae bacterium]
MAVYAAGYWRTRDAARGMEAQAQQRRPVRSESATPMVLPPPMPDATAVGAAEAALPLEPLPAAPELEPEPEPVELVVAQAPAATQSPPEAAVKPAAAKPVAAQPAVAEQADPPVSVAAAVAEPGTAVETPREPEVRTEPYWRDGTFTGWGTSRHGDIKAQVVIRDGRIVESGIVSCETRYPCDVIERIIPQPVQFQGPDVDRVSRATESADAYYYALVNALAEAVVEPALQAAAPK